MLRFFLLLLFIGLSPASNAQQYISSVSSYNQEDGLSHNQIKWIHKDRRGMIWIGASNGISRYDGSKFKLVAEANFFKIYKQAIFEDAQGDLWLKRIQTEEELFFFNTVTAEVKSFEEKFPEGAPFGKNEYVKGIHLSNGTSVIGTSAGQMISYDSTGNFKEQIIEEHSSVEIFPGNDSQSFLVHAISTVKQVAPSASAHNQNRILLFDNFETAKWEIDQVPANIQVLGLLPNYQVLCNNAEGLFTLDNKGQISSHQFEKFNIRLSDTETRFVYDSQKARIWHSSTTSINAYNWDGKSIWSSPPYYKELMVSSKFYYHLEENNLWLGTINGLFKIQLQSTPFKKIWYKNPREQVQSDFISFRGIASDADGNLFAASRRLHSTLLSDKMLSKISKKIKSSRPAFLGLMLDRQNILWSASGDELHRIDPKTSQHQMLSFPNNEKKSPQVWSFFQEKKSNRIWLGTNQGLFFLDEGDSSLSNYEAYNGFEELKQTRIYSIYEGRKNHLWLATEKGIFQMDLQRGILAQYFKDREIRHLHQDKEGVFWIASQEGLIRWDKATNQETVFSIAEGLSHNSLYAVYEDDFGFLWISSDNGLMQFEKKTQRVKTYFPSDGISHREFNYVSHHQAIDGTLYFGSLNGIISFDPQHFVASFLQQPDIPLRLTECHLFSDKDNRQENKMEEFINTGQIVLNPNDRYLRLEFALLEYGASERIQYLYDIDGKEGTPIAENALHISALPYGENLLTIKGRTRNGLYSKQELKVPIIVLKPFYLQWWFICISILALFTSIFLYQKRKARIFLKRKKELEQIVSKRTQTIQVQAEELRLLDKTKSRFLANISHEFRTPLTVILHTLSQQTSKDDKYAYAAVEVEFMRRNARRLQELIDQLLDLSKLEVGKMRLHTQTSDFEYYLGELVRSFQPLARQKQLDLSFHTDLQDKLLSFDRDKMDKIIYNLISNAMKFTAAGGKIEVRLEQNEKEMLVSVKDTGLGIPDEELNQIFDRFYRSPQVEADNYEGTGLGLSLVKELTELHQGSVAVKSELGQGTRFSLRFPLSEKTASAEKVNAPAKTIAPASTFKSAAPDLNTQTSTAETPCLLIIEDNEDLLYHHQKLFGDTYNLLLARDGESGLAMAFEYIPDLIVCDVMMPKKNGYDVCRELKLDERSNHIPVILLTAKASHEEKMEGLLVGADDYLTKPYDQAELSIRLQNLLDLQRRLQRQWATSSNSLNEKRQLPTNRQSFVEKCEAIIEEHLTHRDFGVEKLSKIIGMSRTQLFRKIKSITGTTPTNMIRTYRLKKARQLLLQQVGNASEISYMVGFNNPNYFFKCFKNEFGMTVGAFLLENKLNV